MSVSDEDVLGPDEPEEEVEIAKVKRKIISWITGSQQKQKKEKDKKIPQLLNISSITFNRINYNTNKILIFIFSVWGE